MATVWRADDPLLARSVAIKTLDPVLGEDPDLRSRFRREAVAAAAVAHPNIVATYDTGDDDGVAYIVMELVDGATLRQAINLHGALPPARAADIAAQIADALAAAHARGLVHRDIKPSNVLIQLDGRAKVTDFGIAKVSDQPAEDLTRTGSVMGTRGTSHPSNSRVSPSMSARISTHSAWCCTRCSLPDRPSVARPRSAPRSRDSPPHRRR